MKKYIWRICFIISISITVLLLSSCAPKPLDNSNEKGTELLYAHSNESKIASNNKLNQSAEDFINYGIIDENEYTADNYVSRITAVRIISDITGLDIDAENSTHTHPFVDLSDRAEKQISYLYNHNIIDGVTNNYFMEDEICNVDTFLTFLLKGLNHVGGEQEEVTLQNVREIAIGKGIISATQEEGKDGLFSVNDAFDICHNALYVYINDQETLLTYLGNKGIAQAPD